MDKDNTAWLRSDELTPRARANWKQLADIDKPLDDMTEGLHRRLEALLTPVQLDSKREHSGRPDPGKPAPEAAQTDGHSNE